MDNPLTPVKLRAFDDLDAIRQDTLTNTLQALSEVEPVSYGKYTLTLSDVKAGKSPDISYDAHKKALLKRGTIGTPIWGKWTLKDRETGAEIESQRKLLMHLPTITRHGTYVRRGIEYTVASQQRMLPGVYTHRKSNGELESLFNVAPGTGKQFRVAYDPESNKFDFVIGQAKLPIYPVLKALGADDADIKTAWGDAGYAANTSKLRADVLEKAAERLEAKGPEDEPLDAKIRRNMMAAKLDPDVTRRTLGEAHEAVNPRAILQATRKLLAVHKNEADSDNRDALVFQRVMSHEDLFPERVKKDKSVLRKTMFSIAKRGSLNALPVGVFNKHVDAVMIGSGLAQPLEETNLTEVVDQLMRVSRLGEGAIGSLDAVPDEARAVQPSFAGFIDPIRSPESASIGVDNRFTYGTMKGSDGKLYNKLLNVRTKRSDVVSATQLADSVVAFPGEMESDDKKVTAIHNGQVVRVDRSKVDYVLPAAQQMFTMQSNLMPGISAVAGGRVFLGSKFVAQSMPLDQREAPLVRSAHPDNPASSFENELGKRLGAITASTPGVVTRVDKDTIYVKDSKGAVTKYDMAQYLPHNRRSFLKHDATVKPGDLVRPGQVLATSNMTDKEGTLALGTNLNVAYVPYSRGEAANYEDAVVLSESGAKKLASMEMFQHKLGHEDGEFNKTKYRALFPGNFTDKQIAAIGDDGIVKPGTVVNRGDPLVLAAKVKGPVKEGMGSRSGRFRYNDAAITWEHDAPGVVTDSALGSEGVVVAVAAKNPIHVGDKIAGRYGDKGVVGAILPDARMPQTKDGKPFDLMVNPLGIISRGNPMQLVEAALGKIARKTGKPVAVPGFDKRSYVQYALDELKKHGLSSTEAIVDPETGRTIPNIATGTRFYMRLHHMAEKKLSGRGVGSGYTNEGAPAKGGDESAPRFGLMEINALAANNAFKVLEDAHSYRGHRNEDYWKAVMSGYAPKKPKQTDMLSKFLATLAASGVHVAQNGSRLNIMAMTDKHVDQLATHEITKADTVSWPDLEPISGGLFDRGITGGHGGTKFSKIEFGAKIPNPVMEDPIRKLLSLTENDFRDVLAGKKQLNNETGPQAIADSLRRINLDTQIAAEKATVKSAKRSPRDQAIKRLRLLEMMKTTGLKPEDMLISKIPVLPPVHRPISAMNGIPMVNPANALYKDLLMAKQNYHEMAKELGAGKAGEELLTLYDATKAVIGLGDPVSRESRQKELKGLLKGVFGDSPKTGQFQRKMMGTAVDLGGRAVITPDPRLNMDEVGIPEDAAWRSYRPFVVRRLVRSGMTPAAAMEAVQNKTSGARAALLEETKHRPVMINRAPSLHKFSLMGAWPILTKDKSIKLSPVVTSSFNADFDGDTMAWHVPASEEARQEVIEKMMPSKQLLNVSKFKAQFLPRQEFQLGLWAASKADPKATALQYKDLQAAVQAFKRGEININSIIEVPGMAPSSSLLTQVTEGLLS